ncbi:membrane protein YczE [Nocardiopsis kunsanensis]|uniref:Membrane protein n=1 Tax=Nocardiopsis kunsanensis TaxID=141693 RepID=A0A918XLW4_9ACTN|nr:membrane protein [Nocardiopsis kunsanensis]GHD36784.1 membrane protein [Nocardiopsis kunsanensis]
MSAPSRRSAPALVQRLLITPVLPRPRLRRLAQLYVGLYLYGLSGALLLRSDLGAMPWDVLHQGLSLQTGLSIGTWSIIIGTLLMLLWIPLRQKAGLGTLSNVIVIGLSVDLSLWLLPTTDLMPLRLLLLALGVLVCAVATGCYIGVGLGPGPRDGLMTGLAGLGLSIRLARTLIEVTVALLGFLLGGTVGVGTVVFMLAIGPLTQVFLPLMRMSEPPRPPRSPAPRTS